MSGYGSHYLAAPPVNTASSHPPTLTQCLCSQETLRLSSVSQHFAHVSMTIECPPGDHSLGAQSSLLPTTLTIARDLVRHWGALNCCPNVDSHMETHTLCALMDAIGLIMRGHRLAIETWRASKVSAREASRAAAATARPMYRAMIGDLELETAEADIVVQESLRYSIRDMAVMAQDIVDEAVLIADKDQDAYPLKGRDVTGLIESLFSTLGTVDRINTS